MNTVSYENMQRIEQLVYRSCKALNDEAWNDFLGVCDPQAFQYKVVVYTPEIRKEQVWADRDFKTMKSSFDLLPRHNSDRSKLTRHVNVQVVDFDAQKMEALVQSSLTIYRTQLDGTMSYLEGGQTSLYAIGSYHDRIRLTDGDTKILERTVHLDTRQLDVGSHKPF